MDSDSNVLAVEYLNDDAKDAFAAAQLTGVALEDSLKNMIEAAIEKNYLQDGKDVQLEVEEIRATAVETETILQTAKETVEATLSEKSVTANVITIYRTTADDTASNPPAGAGETGGEATSVNCSRCNGTGECQGCHGGKDACPACDGTGYETCPMCDANGLDHGQTCATYGDSHHYLCTHCLGAGTAMDCPECGGTFKCPACGGTGKQQ